MRAHRFIWECYKGLIIDDKLVIKHLDNNPRNNSLDNLMLDTTGNNQKDAYKDGLRTMGKGKDNPVFHPKPVIRTNLETKKEKQFKSVYQASKKIGVNSRSVQRVCDGDRKSITSKVSGIKYTFRYVG